jgi:hypothetical protein
MDVWRILLAPLYAACLVALVVAAFAFGRRDPESRPLRLPLVWFGILAVGSLCVALQFRGAPSLALPTASAAKAAGLGLLMLAAGLAVRGSQTRSRADLLRASAPTPLDEAVAALRAGRAPGWGVYQGRLEAAEVLTSPGGAPCAFFEAEVRAVAPDGRKGPLLARERAYAPALVLRGERVRASVRFSPSSLLAPVEVRRCQVAPGLVPASCYEEAPASASMSHAGEAPPEALSWERVGAPGETCLVVGELRRGPTEGSYQLSGRGGGPALVVLGPEAPATGGSLARRAWGHFAAAGALSMVAALVLARAM